MKRWLMPILGTLMLVACGDDGQVDAPEHVAGPAARATSRTVLVAGATGRQGGAVARALLERGYQVRGLTRDPDSERARVLAESGMEMVRGDFEDPASLDAALVGAYGAFSVQNFWDYDYESEVRQGKHFADAARRAGVAHFVYSSVAAAERNTGIPHFDSKFEIEQHIRAIGLPFTILRPVSFMENWEYQRDEILAGVLRAPQTPDSRHQQIAVRDIGYFAAEAFDHPDQWLGRALDIAGDQFTKQEIAGIFSRVIGRDVKYQQVPWAVFEAEQGPEMTIMERWFQETGYDADVDRLRADHPHLLTLEQYLRASGWDNAALAGSRKIEAGVGARTKTE